MFTKSFTFISSARACPRAPLSLSSRTFTFQATRFAQSSARQAAKPKAKQTIQQPQSARKPTTTTTTTTTIPKDIFLKDFRFIGKRSEGLAALERKVVSQKEVLLFQAPSQRVYIFGAYGIAAFAFGYAIINSSLGIQDTRAQLPAWQRTLYVGVCIVMSVMGTVFVGRTSRLIKKIVAVDSHGQTLVNVTVRSVIPFRTPYTITVAPQQIIFSRKLVVGPRLPREFARTKDIKVSFFKEPLRAVNFAFFRIFISVRRIFTQEDFIMMEMGGQKGAFRLGINGDISPDLLAIAA